MVASFGLYTYVIFNAFYGALNVHRNGWIRSTIVWLCIPVFMLSCVRADVACIAEKPPVSIEINLALSLEGIILNVPITVRSDKPMYSVRYIIDIIALSGQDAGKSVYRAVDYLELSSANEYVVCQKLELSPEKYNILAWCDYVPQSTTDDYYYCATDLNAITYTLNHVGCTNDKDAFSASAQIDLSTYNSAGGDVKVKVEMMRPHGKYKIVSTDYAKYLNHTSRTKGSDPSYAIVKYQGAYPYGYCIATGVAAQEYVREGVTYRADITEENGDFVLCFDYVFVTHDDKAIVSADIAIYDENDKLINTADITIPVYRSKRTVIKGEFFTGNNPVGGGGIGITDDFDDEIIIEI